MSLLSAEAGYAILSEVHRGGTPQRIRGYLPANHILRKRWMGFMKLDRTPLPSRGDCSTLPQRVLSLTDLTVRISRSEFLKPRFVSFA